MCCAQCQLGVLLYVLFVVLWFFFQAEDGIRDLVRSRGLGDVYKRQLRNGLAGPLQCGVLERPVQSTHLHHDIRRADHGLSLIHI